MQRASQPFGLYQVILLGDRGTYVWITCPKSLPDGGKGRNFTQINKNNKSVSLGRSHCAFTGFKLNLGKVLYLIAKWAQNAKFLTVNLELQWNQSFIMLNIWVYTYSVCRRCESNSEFKGNKWLYLALLFCRGLLFNSKAVLSRWKPCDVAQTSMRRPTEIYSRIARASLR